MMNNSMSDLVPFWVDIKETVCDYKKYTIIHRKHRCLIFIISHLI